ncbi:MAG: hypothetical protein J6Y90_07295, partial [Lachnospiraceae bacterium]|nr:hypothetical protein [Lachnospiraceae bacterium]
MKKKSMISIALAATMVVCDSPLALAADKNTPKEEVVYINLTPEGKVDNVTAVNVFNLAKAGDILDYGNYISVRNMTTTDEIDYDTGKVRMSADAGRIYYEGTLGKVEIPWTIALTYTLDGKTVTASELSGQSGFLRMHLTVKPNSNSAEVFYKHYALQISLTLDTEICSNISATGATSANVGSDRQLTYTLLPGKEADILVSTDVKDFHMDPIAINGILLDMNIGEIDINSGEAGDIIDELTDGAKKLDDGVSELLDGTDSLRSGAKELTSGSSALRDGIVDFRSGTSKLKTGASSVRSAAAEISSGASALNGGAGELAVGVDGISGGASALADGIGELGEGADAVAKGAVEVASGANELSSGANELSSGADDAAKGAKALDEGVKTLGEGANALTKGVGSVKGAAVELGRGAAELGKGVGSIIDGATSLRGGVEELSDGIKQTGSGAAQLSEGATGLSEGAKSLSEGAKSLNGGISEVISAVGEIANGLSGLASKNNQLTEGAYEAFEGICKSAESVINTKLADYDLGTVTLTPNNYKTVLNGLLEQLDADALYDEAYNRAREEVTSQVNEQADELYDGYIRQNADMVIDAFLDLQKEEVYDQAVTELIVQKLLGIGVGENGARMLVETRLGQAIVNKTLQELTDEEHEQIIATVKAVLTDEEKEQIFEGAVAQLTDEEKEQIREGYIEELMVSDEVLTQIQDAVGEAGEAASQIADLKGQLDSFNVFYDGLVSYTEAVASAAKGARTLRDKLPELSDAADSLAKGASDIS